MIPLQLEVIPNQEKKIHAALKKEKACRLKVKKVNNGPHNLLVRNKYAKRYHETSNGKEIALPFSHGDLVQNLHHRGGFLPLIAAALGPIIAGVAGGLIEKGIAGSGFRSSGRPWWHGGNIKDSSGEIASKGGRKKKNLTKKKKKSELLYSMEKRGNGLYLAPWKSY